MKNKSRSVDLSGFLITISIIILFNPVVKLVDILPDFIAYFILAHLVYKITEFIPYASELRSALLKLGVINLLRIPIGMMAISVGSTSATEQENLTITLTLIFSVIECIYSCIAISNLYNMIVYMGERSDSSSLISPFPISKRRRMDIDQMKIFTIAFVVTKNALCALPEMLLLYFDPYTLDLSRFRIRAAYPYCIIISVLVVALFGVVWVRRALKFKSAISSRGEFQRSVEFFLTNDTKDYIESNRALAKKKNALTAMIIASCLTYDINIIEYKEINLLPHFIFGILLIIALLRLNISKRHRLICGIGGSLYVASGILFWTMQTIFLSKRTYSDLLYFESAKNEYMVVLILSLIEFFFACVFLISTAITMRSFTLSNTAIDTSSPNYSRADRDLHIMLTRKGFIYAILGILMFAAKTFNVFLKTDVKYIFTDNGTGASVIYTTPIPWFGLLITVITTIFAGFSFYYFGMLKDETDLKYKYEMKY